MRETKKKTRKETGKKPERKIMNIIIMLLLISFLILVHELGHFLSARALGIKVDKFGFGLPFGPTLFKGKIGDTEILVHALLLGGYVAFPDDDPESKEEKNPEDMFKNKPIWKRTIVVSAGVIANVICAIFLVMLTAAIWHKLPAGKYNITVANVTAPKTASVHYSGLKKGDKIYKINGSEIFQPFQINKFATESKNHDGLITNEIYTDRLKALKEKNPQIKDVYTPLEKGKEIQLVSLKDEKELKLSKAALMGMEKIKQDSIKLNKKQTDLRDKIQGKKEYKTDGETSLSDIAKALADTKKPMYFTVIRDVNGEKKEVELKPIYSDDKGIIGIQQNLDEILLSAKTPKEIVKSSLAYTYRITDFTILGLAKLFTGQIPVKELHGIVAITKVGGDMIQQTGLFNGLLLTAIISINLAIMNLLPIPALDGGHLLFLAIEKIKGKPLDEEVIAKISNFFFMLLIVLMLLIVFNDIFALITKKI